MASSADLYELLRKIRYDCTAIQAKLTDAFALLAELDLPERPPALCPSCGLGFKGLRTLAEHVYTSHAGPLPTHWLRTDELAVDAAEPEPSQRTDSAVRDRSTLDLSPIELTRLARRAAAPPPRQGGSAK